MDNSVYDRKKEDLTNQMDRVQECLEMLKLLRDNSEFIEVDGKRATLINVQFSSFDFVIKEAVRLLEGFRPPIDEK